MQAACPTGLDLGESSSCPIIPVVPSTRTWSYSVLILVAVPAFARPRAGQEHLLRAR